MNTVVTQSKKRILIANRYYLPGYKAGGPIRSLSNLATVLSKKYKVFVVTLNRDLGTSPYTTVPTNKWVCAENGIEVFYLADSEVTLKRWVQLTDFVAPDFIYLNSFFDLQFSIYLQFLKRCQNIVAPLILTPRGELKQNALQISKIKKTIYLKVYKWFLKNNSTKYHACDFEEKMSINRHLGVKNPVLVAGNLPYIASVKPKNPRLNSALRICTVGRLHKIKNIIYLIDILDKIKNIDIQLTIIGAIDQIDYWKNCCAKLEQLSPNVQWQYLETGDLSWVLEQVASHHLFFSPTLTESFGHSIAEALSVGTPVLISDKTPWRNLEQSGIGWDIPLDKPELYIEAIRTISGSSERESAERRSKCYKYIQQHYLNGSASQQYEALFS